MAVTRSGGGLDHVRWRQLEHRQGREEKFDQSFIITRNSKVVSAIVLGRASPTALGCLPYRFDQRQCAAPSAASISGACSPRATRTKCCNCRVNASPAGMLSELCNRGVCQPEPASA